MSEIKIRKIDETRASDARIHNNHLKYGDE